MKKLLLLLVLFLNLQQLLSKDNMTLYIYNTGTACKEGSRISLLDGNKDEFFDLFVFLGCNQKSTYTHLVDKSTKEITFDMIATLHEGSFADMNYKILISNPENYTNVCLLYYDAKISKTVLEDYKDSQEDPGYFEEADNYFYFRQAGSYIFMTKKAELDIQSITLCNLSGIVLDKLTNTYSVGEFYFDLRNNPAGLYLIRIITNDKQLTKKIVYLK
ncbi:MAG: hypothetical protein QG635_1541 [Bacteroidota bacterium]|nr:hypothetical protein [Bacteroidota bacterium]